VARRVIKEGDDMSVATMADLASDEPRSAAADSSYLRQLAKYIPSEAIAIYLLALGLFVPVTGTTTEALAWKWVALIVGLVLALVIIGLTFRADKSDKRSKLIWLLLFAVVGFLVYTLATPGGPWPDPIFGVAATAVGTVAAVFYTAVAPLLAPRVGFRASGE
jgi:RsiW-degrading membrane proteinase PrsW (M82 family)